MKWLTTLENKFGHHAIPGITRIIVALNALVFCLAYLKPSSLALFDLQPERVLHGEVWRLVTYIFIPPSFSLLWIVFALSFLMMLGDGLEHAWGAFKLNLFYLTGMIGCTIAAFFFGGATTNVYLNLSLLFAFATIYPNETIYLFFVLPVKIKWLAYLALFFELQALFLGSFAQQMAIATSLGNYLLFFGPMIIENARMRRKVASRQREFESKSIPKDEALHLCALCKKTELTNPETDFRIARDGEEYCVEHLPSAVTS